MVFPFRFIGRDPLVFTITGFGLLDGAAPRFSGGFLCRKRSLGKEDAR